MMSFAAATSAVGTTAAMPAVRRPSVAGQRATRVSPNPNHRRSVRSYAASGGSFPPGEVKPLGAVELSQCSEEDASADMLVVSMCEGDAEKFEASGDAVFEKFGEGLGAIVYDLMQETEFKGKPGSSCFTRLPTGGKHKFKHVGVVGIGKPEGITTDTWSSFGSSAAAAAQKAKCGSVLVGKYWMGDEESDFRVKVESIATGALVGSYEDQRFKSEKQDKTLSEVKILTQQGVDVAVELDKGRANASGVVLTKQLVAAPPNVVTPTALAQVAADIAAEYPDVMSLKVLEKAECEKMGMGSFLGVAEASDEPPKFIHLTYTPKGGANAKVAVVGKGLTFDSGGYNIKAGAGSMIEMMKFDMGGSGAVLGAARIVAETAPEDVEAHFIVASCENMIGSRGLRPGDILTASNGKTIEVNNTDAEGRLTLADALVYAEKTAGAEKIVDVATLTGACIVALGPEVAGVFTPDDDMAASLDDAAKASGELFWRMPMQDTYWAACGMKSEYADMKNTGSRGGGAITAALFLKQFIEKEETKWAHLDIAGPVWDDKKGGATGFAASTLAKWIASSKK